MHYRVLDRHVISCISIRMIKRYVHFSLSVLKHLPVSWCCYFDECPSFIVHFIYLFPLSKQVVLISGETGCGKTTQVTTSLLCVFLWYLFSHFVCLTCLRRIPSFTFDSVIWITLMALLFTYCWFFFFWRLLIYFLFIT